MKKTYAHYLDPADKFIDNDQVTTMKFRAGVCGVFFAAIAIGFFDVRDASAQGRRLFQRRASDVSAAPDVTTAPSVTAELPVAPVVGNPPIATYPFVAPYPPVPIHATQPGFGLAAPYGVPMYGYIGPNLYLAPYPWYSILPPVNPYANPGLVQTRGGYDPFGHQQRTAEDFGYKRQDFDGQPRKRPPEAPGANQDLKTDARRVRFVVTVPTADALLFFDGAKTKQTGLERTFVTPPLDEEKIYTSVIEIQYINSRGEKQSLKESFEFFPGETVKYRATPKVKGM